MKAFNKIFYKYFVNSILSTFQNAKKEKLSQGLFTHIGFENIEKEEKNKGRLSLQTVGSMFVVLKKTQSVPAQSHSWWMLWTFESCL